MTPRSKKIVIKDSRITETNYNSVKRNLQSEEEDARILKYFEESDISYICPGRKDTVYMGKKDLGTNCSKRKTLSIDLIRKLDTKLCLKFYSE